MKFCIKIIAIILISGSAYAQPKSHLGLTTGFNSTHVLDKGLKSDPNNYLLMHAMAPNVSGVIGSAIAAGIILSFLG